MDIDLSLFKVTQPCRNCPFRTDANRILFRSRARAEEIEEHAYRQGFPCHETADTHEDLLTGMKSLAFGSQASHCAGYLVMKLKSEGGGGAPWPGIGNDTELSEALSEHFGNWLSLDVFESEEEFFQANETDAERRSREETKKTR